MKKLALLLLGTVSMCAANAQYCVPTYTNLCSSNDYIDAVDFRGIQNSATGCNGNVDNYIYYSNDTAQVNSNGIYPITLTPTTAYAQGFGVWIDFNGDGDFADIGEFVLSTSVGMVPVTNDIAIPLTATLGNTMMRVRCVYNAVIVSADSCNGKAYGETEDYPVTISPPLTNDVGILAFDAPLTGCVLSAAESIVILVRNYSSSAKSNIPVSYRVNGGAAVNDTITGPLSPGDTAVYTFTATYDLSNAGSYVLDAWTGLAGDEDTTNDSLNNHVIDLFSIVSTFPYLEDYESGSGSWVADGSSSSWALGLPQKTTIDTASSGVNAWVTGGLGTGTYNTNENSFVRSPCFDFSGLVVPIIELDVWWNSEYSQDGAVLQSSIDGGATWQNVGEFGDPDNWYNDNTIFGNPGGQQEGWTGRNSTGNGSAGWVTARHSLMGLGGETGVLIRIAFGASSFTEDDGFAFDDVSIFEAPAAEVGVIAIGPPVSDCELSSTESVFISVVNFGSAAQSNIPVSYRVNGGAPVNETVPGPVNPEDTVIYAFTTTVDLSTPGNYVFDAWTSLVGDADSTNDSLNSHSVDIFTIISAFPYLEDYESGSGSWVADGSSSSWALGLPQKTTIDTASSGVNAWVTGGLGTGTYNTNENSFVRSPCFDFSGLVVPIIELDVWWNSEYRQDGAVLQSSIDGGATWQNVGEFGDPDNWYNGNTIFGYPGGQLEGWTGRNSTGDGSAGWVTARHYLTGLGGETGVLIRIAFGANSFSEDDGFAFDDVSIFEAPAAEVGVIAIGPPVSDCELSSAESVFISVANFGSAAQSNIPVSYRVNGGAPVNEIVPGPVNPEDTVIYAFTTTVDLSTPGNYAFDTWTNLGGDADMTNDSLTGYNVLNPLISTFPFTVDFESESICPNVCGSACVLSGNWTNSSDDNIDWIVYEGVTPSVATGPEFDHTIGTVTGNYLYIEASGCYAQEAALFIPCLDISLLSNPQITFWYHMYGATMGALFIEADTGGVWFALDSLNGQQQANQTDPWLKKAVPVPPFSGVMKIRFRGVTGAGFESDMAIDDITIRETPVDDVGIAYFVSPGSGCELSATENIIIGVVNFGIVAQSNIPVSYRVNGGAPVNETIAGPLNPGDTAVYTFAATYDLSNAGNFVFDAWTSLTGDEDTTNDSLNNHSVDLITIVSVFPYLEDYESGSGDWVAGGSSSSWALGLPQKTVINTASSGVNSWVTGGLSTGTYNANENSFVRSPCFDFSSLVIPVLEFNVWWNSEYSVDGTVLQSSIDGGVTWQNVGSYGDPNSWYNDNGIWGNPGGQQEGWTGRNSTGNGSAGWVTARHALTGLGGETGVLIRIAFGADPWTEDDGFAFDDVSIFEAPAAEVGVVAIGPPVSDCGLSSAESVVVGIANFGSAAQSNIPVSYRVNGGVPVNDTIPGPINPEDTAYHAFITTADLSTSGNYVFDAWSNLTGDTYIANDSLIGYNVENYPIHSVFPYSENFESETVCANTCGYACVLSGEWTNSSDDYTDWMVNKGPTSSSNTGPEFDHTVGTVSGNYLYLEASASCSPSQEAILTSPCLDIGGLVNPQVSFWCHMYGINMGKLFIEVDTGGVWFAIDSLIGQQQAAQTDPWMRVTATIPAFSGVMRMRFRGVTGTTYFSDMAIDDITIQETPVNDIELINITEPVGRCGLTTNENITVQITNWGTNTQTNIPITYVLNGGSPVSEVIPDTISLGEELTYTFSQTADLTTEAMNTLVVYTGLAGDDNLDNDTLSTSIFYGDIETYIVINTSIYGPEVNWEISDYTSGQVVATGSGYANNSTYVDTVCLSSASNYIFSAYDTYGDGWNGGTYAVTRCDTSNTVINNGGATPNNSQCCGSELESTEAFSVYPCIANNLGVIAITEPISSCELSDSATVTIEIFNFGDSAQVNIPVAYQLNGGTPVIETISDSINSGDLYTYSFTTTADLTSFSSNSFNAWTALVDDSLTTNDTLFDYSVVDADIASFPYKEDFETFTPGLPGTLEDKWTNDSLDNFEWYVHTGTTPSANTGPVGDNSSGSGVYMYARAAFNTPVDTAILYSPCVNISTLANPRLSFWYHMYGSGVGSLAVEWDSSGTWIQLGSISGPQQSAGSDPWQRVKIDISGYSNMRQLRFVAITGSVSEGDIALDDVKIYSEHCNNGISDYDEEGIDCGGEDCETVCPVTFQIAYGGEEEEHGLSAQQTNDGGYIIAGTTKSYGFAQTLTDIYVIKTDSLGDTLWTRTYGETGSDYAKAIRQTADSGYIIVGHTESFGIGNDDDFYLLKIDSAGVVEWSKTFNQSTYSSDYCYDIIQTADLGYALAGNSGYWYGGYVIKTDATGTVEWSTKVAGVDFRSILQESANEYIVAGSTTTDPNNAILMKIHPSTDSIVWSKQYGGFGRDYGTSLAKTSDGGYMIGGYSYSFGTGGNPVALLIKTDGDGVLEWSKTYGGPESDYAYSVQQTTDDGYILSGETRSFGYGDNILMVRTDSLGEVVWGRVFDAGGYINYTDNGNHVEQTSDNGFLAIGSTKNMGAGTFEYSWSDLDEPDIYLIKTDPYGNTFLCNEDDVTLSLDITVAAVTESLLVATISATGTETTRTTLTNPTETESMKLEYIDITGFNTKDVSCYNGYDGYAVVQSTGGTAFFNYTWTKANTYYGWSYSADSAYSLRADAYYVTISAKNACQSSDTVEISQPDSYLSLPYTTTPTTCFGYSDGGAEVSVTGGTPPYSYTWSTGDTTETISDVGSNWYTLQVLDSNNCMSTEYIYVGEPSQVSATYNIDLVKCKGGNDGAVNLTMNTGIPPYSFTWSTGDSIEDIDTLVSGYYSIIVVDSTNCTMEDSVFVGEPDSLMTTMSQQSTSCNGYCDGSATVIGSGGTLPYIYLWNDPSAQATATASGLCVLDYLVVLTDNNNCTTSDSITVTEPSTLTTSMTKKDVSCNGSGDGTATITVSGGTAPYTYLWNNGQNTSTAIGLFPGTYGVNVFDANGCLTSNNIIVIEPAVISAAINSNDAICFGGSGGSADLMVSGGTAPYSYLWSTGDTTEDLSGLNAGTYSVSITDSCGAGVTGSAVINEPDSLVSSIAVQGTSCNSGIDGAANMTITGGTAPFTFLWSNGAITEDIAGVAAGTYSVTITDSCGVVINDTAFVYEPAALTTSITGTDVSCNGSGDGSAITTPSGGTTPYLYSWNNGQTNSAAIGLFAGNYTVNVVDVNGCLASNIITINEPAVLVLTTSVVGATCNNADGNADVAVNGGTAPYNYAWNDPSTQTDSLAVGLIAGNYTVTVVDGNLCTDSADVTVNTAVEAPEVCLVSIDSATQKYVVVWEKTGAPIDSFRIYRESSTTSVYDLVGSQPYLDTSTFIDLTSYPEVKSELYKISAIDSCGNESALSAYHRSLHLISSSGLGNDVVLGWDNYIGFSFAKYRIWRGSSQGSLTLLDSVSSSISTYTDTLPPSLDSLFYQLEVIHPIGCVASKTKNFNSSKSNTSSFSTDPNIEASVSTTDASVGICDGEAIVTATGGVAPYTFQWDAGTGNQTSQTAIGLCVGLYDVTVYDANGDSVVASAAVGQVGGIITATTSTTDATQDLCNGTATVTALGGFEPYTYVWDGNAGSQTTQTASNLCAGTYSVTVIDSVGNQTVVFATVVTATGIGIANSSGFEVNVYPNPNRGLFNLAFQLTKPEYVSIGIFNVHGQKLVSEQLGKISGDILKPVDISSFASGVYYVQIMTDENITLEKIVVQ